MRYRYTYKYFPGQGYAGFVNNKRFTGFYDERDLDELKAKLRKEEENRENETKNVPPELSFRDYLIKHGDPEFVKDYLDYISKK
jgi:hypothetical protein